MYFTELRRTLALAGPLMCSQLLSFALPVIDTVMAGRHSTLTLAAVALGAQIFSFIYVFAIGVLVASATQIARAAGAQDPRQLRRAFQRGLELALLLGLLTALLTFCSPLLLDLIGTDPAVAAASGAYLRALAPGGFLAIIALGARFFLEGVSYPRVAIVVQLLSLPSNVLGNQLLLYGWGPLPALGATGMAIATDISYGFSAAALLISIRGLPRFAGLRLRRPWAPFDFGELRDLLRLGLPIGLANLCESGLFVFVGLLASRESALLSATNQIALNYTGLSFMLPLGLAQALTVRVGQISGAGGAGLRACVLSGFGATVLLMLMLAALAIGGRDAIVAAYSSDPAIARLARELLLVVGLFQVADGLQVCAMGLLRGLHQGRAALGCALWGYWLIGIPAALLLGKALGLGLLGLWLGCAVGLLATAVLGWRHIYRHLQGLKG